MTDIIRGELVLRRCRGNDGNEVDIHVGWLSAPKDTFRVHADADRMMTAARFTASPHSIMLLGGRLTTRDILPDSDLASNLTRIRFPGSVSEEDDFVSGGALILRATRQDDERGMPVMLAALVMQATGPEADPAIIYEVRGKATSLSMTPTKRRFPMQPNGMALTQIHRSPVWSIDGDELCGPVSTMRLDVLDECQRLEDLIAQDPTADRSDDPEYRRLTSGPAGMLVTNITRDPQYAAYRRRMADEGLTYPWNEFVSASYVATVEAKSSEIVKSLLGGASA